MVEEDVEVILFRIVEGPDRDRLTRLANFGQKASFVCSDHRGKVVVFDLRVEGLQELSPGSHELAFTGQDSIGLWWTLTYSPESGSGDMLKNFRKKASRC